MNLTPVKERIGKFLLGESGSISKKSIAKLGLISFIISASADNVQADKLEFERQVSSESYDADEGVYRMCFRGHISGDDYDDNNTMSFPDDLNRGQPEDTVVLPEQLFYKGIYSIAPSQLYLPGFGFSPDAIATIPSLDCGHLSDHISGGPVCAFDNHFSASSGPHTLVPPTLHENSTELQLLGEDLKATHAHVSLFMGEKVTLTCHTSDHFDAHSSCGWHGNNKIC